MKRMLGLFIFLAVACAAAQAQEKGVDNQNDRIRDQSSDRTAGVNGTKVNVGTGRGIDFGKGRTPTPPPIPNPFRFTARRDVVIRAAQELMAERQLVLDTAVSKPEEGMLITQPYKFVKGAVVAPTELNRLAEVPQDNVGGWTQGRYTLVVEVQAIDGVTTTVAVNARVEGRTDGAAGAEWNNLRSNGTAEQEFLRDLIGKITGGAP
jgi:hypothetical protein